MKWTVIGLVFLVLMCSSVAIADSNDDPDFPDGASINNSTALGIDVDPSTALTNEPINVTAVNLTSINTSTDDVFVSWDLDRDGIAESVGHNASWSYDEVGTYTIAMYATDGKTERVVVTNVTVNAGVAPVVNASPRDIDSDGLYEDVNGDGQANVLDVLDYYEYRTDDTIRKQVDAFDFDGDGSAGTVFDAIELYDLISN